MSKLRYPFTVLKDELSFWRNIEYGLWPIWGWPDDVLENYALTLQETCDSLFSGATVVCRVRNSNDLVVLIERIQFMFCTVFLIAKTDLPDDHPFRLLETIKFALIGALYPEERGLVTIEEILAEH
jgi:hypothetical protein